MKLKGIIFLLGLLAVQPVFASEDVASCMASYFEYLPNAVHNSWIPYKAPKDYDVLVQFRIKRDGNISRPFVVNSTNVRANPSAVKAVEAGAPYRPLPSCYKQEDVKTRIELRYIK